MSDDNMYTFRVPGIIDASIRDLTKEAARIQDEVIQEALTARGWISPDDRKAHDDEVRQAALKEVVVPRYLPGITYRVDMKEGVALRVSSTQTSKEALAVIEAWTNKGANPKYHLKAKERLRREWPVLYRSIEKLAKERGRS